VITRSALASLVLALVVSMLDARANVIRYTIPGADLSVPSTIGTFSLPGDPAIDAVILLSSAHCFFGPCPLRFTRVTGDRVLGITYTPVYQLPPEPSPFLLVLVAAAALAVHRLLGRSALSVSPAMA
jgi:hypothetical protein